MQTFAQRMSVAAASTSLLDLLIYSFLRPRKKSMRLDVRMKRLAAPFPRNPVKKRTVPTSDQETLRGMFNS